MRSSPQALFSTVPNDVFNFFENNAKAKVKPEEVVKFFKYKKRDIASAVNIPLNTVRYEPNKIPKELVERLTEWAVAINLVAGFFNNDQDKTILWFSMPNPMLGGISPKDMIRVGRFKKLLNFIQTALDENQSNNSSDSSQK